MTDDELEDLLSELAIVDRATDEEPPSLPPDVDWDALASRYEEEEELSPADWWDQFVENTRDSDELKRALDTLVAAGCQRVDLLERLRALHDPVGRSRAKKAVVKRYWQDIERVVDMMAAFAYTDVAARLRSPIPWEELNDHAAELKAYLNDPKNWRSRPKFPVIVAELIRYVHHHVRGKQHVALATLLSGVGPDVSPEALRTATSRLGKRQPLSKKPKLKARKLISRPRSGRARRL